MSLSLSSLQHLSASTVSTAGTVITLPVRVAARALGLARGTVSVVHDRVAGPPAPGTPWQTVDVPAADPTSPTLDTEPGTVNVVEELGLDAAPVEQPTPTPPRTAPVTGIDEQAEPRLVDSTPADVAARIARQA